MISEEVKEASRKRREWATLVAMEDAHQREMEALTAERDSLRAEVERLREDNNRLWQANLKLVNDRDRAALSQPTQEQPK